MIVKYMNTYLLSNDTLAALGRGEARDLSRRLSCRPGGLTLMFVIGLQRSTASFGGFLPPGRAAIEA
jgi:hypothetical protein